MKQVTVELYKYSELSDKAKEKAISEMSDINVGYDWWESTYEDAKNIGLKITAHDIDRGSYAKGEFMASAEETAHKIEKDHGETCETYKTAAQYLEDRDKAIGIAGRDEDGEIENEYELDKELDELDAEFLKSLLEDYRIMLQHDYEYQTSDEAIIETIEANDYDFGIDGSRGVTIYNAD